MGELSGLIIVLSVIDAILAKKNVKALALDGIELGPLCIYAEKKVCHTFYDENPPLKIPGYEANM